MRKSFYSLIGVNGNAFAVMRYVIDAMRDMGCSREDMDEYKQQAMSGDYNNLLAVSMDIIEKLNSQNGCRDGIQYTEPDVIEESRGTKKITFKKLMETLKDYAPAHRYDAYSEDGEFANNDIMFNDRRENDEDDFEDDMDYDKMSVIWKALDEAVFQLWEEFGPFEPEDVYSWVKQATDRYPIEQLSIFKKLSRSRSRRDRDDESEELY